jgi:hypothetical protein
MFVIVCHFLPSLIFAGGTRNLTVEWSPARSFTEAVTNLFCKEETLTVGEGSVQLTSLYRLGYY